MSDALWHAAALLVSAIAGEKAAMKEISRGLPLTWCTCAINLALLIDVLLGEPPWRLHPVVWMGYYLGAMGRIIAPTKVEANGVLGTIPGASFLKGACAWLLGAAGWVGCAALLQQGIRRLPWAVGIPLLAALLKPMLAWRMLRDEVRAVEKALSISLEAGREKLTHLVSRDTTKLDQAEVRESAIESLSENYNDSVVGPLLFFALAGLPGAVLYRFANTADSMWGYPGWRGKEKEERDWSWAGKWAARVDDVLSWPGARLSAIAFLADQPRLLWARLPSEARLTPSPNGGWPMGAMALALGIRLGKPGGYQLNATGRKPTPEDTERAVWRTTWVMSGVAILTAAVGLVGLLTEAREA